MILSGLVVSTGRTSKDEPKFPWCIVGQLRMSPFSSAAACDLGYTQERTSAPPHGSALSGQPDPPFTDDQKAAYAGALIRATRASGFQERRVARSQHPPSSEKYEFPRPHSLHRPAFLWSNRSEVWGRTLVELA